MEFKFGLFRFNWHGLPLRDGWKHISLHYNNDRTEHYFNWHIAYRFKFPFLKFGFSKIWKLIQ